MYEIKIRHIGNLLKADPAYGQGVADKEYHVAKAREALDAMTVGMIETMGLVIGLLAAHASTLTIGLTGFISTMGGAIALMSIAYVSSKANYMICTRGETGSFM